MDDTGHRPNLNYRNEEPQTRFDRGPEGIEVKLINWGPKEKLLETIWAASQTTWGETSVPVPDTLDDNQMAYVDRMLAGQTPANHIIETITFIFQISGISRACTHQLVRTRIGAGGSQQGGRDNDWRHHSFRIPETVYRLFTDDRTWYQESDDGMIEELVGCLIATKPLDDFLNFWCRDLGMDCEDQSRGARLRRACWNYVERGKQLYAALVDAGIPWQDARRFLFIGLETHLTWGYSLPALRAFLANRLEFIMDWEINCVAQLMRREVYMNCPHAIGDGMLSHSERQGKSAFIDLDLWPPDGRFAWGSQKDRVHRPEQNPFWVLHPDSVFGASVRWIPTNGTHPFMREINDRRSLREEFGR